MVPGGERSDQSRPAVPGWLLALAAATATRSARPGAARQGFVVCGARGEYRCVEGGGGGYSASRRHGYRRRQPAALKLRLPFCCGWITRRGQRPRGRGTDAPRQLAAAIGAGAVVQVGARSLSKLGRIGQKVAQNVAQLPFIRSNKRINASYAQLTPNHFPHDAGEFAGRGGGVCLSIVRVVRFNKHDRIRRPRPAAAAEAELTLPRTRHANGLPPPLSWPCCAGCPDLWPTPTRFGRPAKSCLWDTRSSLVA